eukprot:m.352525 g.352525  ORF g.352525 m.352525 type:complete len:271 (-) comp16545_c0_seq1:37-849(-)
MSTPLKYQLVEPQGKANGKTAIFIHGWPDNLEMWLPQAQRFAERGYRCASLGLPNYAGKVEKATGYNLEQVTDMIAETIKVINDGKPVLLIAHDWGALLSYMLDSRHTGLVEKMVTVDIGPGVKPKTASAVLLSAGYQLWNIFAFFWCFIPLIGPPIGSYMTYLVSKYFAGAPTLLPHVGNVGYLYFYLWKGMFTGKGGFHIRRYKPSVPLLYFYGARKPFHFHTDRFLALLDESSTCKAVKVDSGHWVHVARAQLFFDETIAFLENESL